MKKLFSLFILSFVIVLSASAQDISSALRQAEARFSSGNETGAIELVTKVLQKYPDNQEAKALLEKFNKTIADREIDADWQTAQSTNTFEAYEQFRTKHPGSKYDDTASDNMAKRLADKFTTNSSYSDRTRAESYAKKGMTKDYIANKWKAAMAKKTSSSSTSSSSSYRSSNTTSTSNSYSSSYSSNNRYGSSQESNHSSSSSYNRQSYSSYKSIPDKTKFAVGIEGALDGLGNSISTSWGLSMRIGAFNSLFNLTIGTKIQYSSTYEDLVSYSYHNYDYWYGYNHEFHSAWYKHTALQLTIPIVLNWNVARNESFAFYFGAGFEPCIVISEKDKYNKPGEEGFNVSEYLNSDDYETPTKLCLPAHNIILQMGFGGRHWDGRLYYKIYTNNLSHIAADPGAFGIGFTYYF